MELCKKVQSEEYVVHAVGSTNFYTRLQFSLLASSWFPRPLGVCLWSALHVFLVLYEALVLLVTVPSIFVLAILMDALIMVFMIYFDLVRHVGRIVAFVVWSIIIAVVWLWLIITCKCCNMPGRAPGQGLGYYLCTAGGTLHFRPQDLQATPAEEEGPCPFVKSGFTRSIALSFVIHVILVSFPYRRARLGDSCREIVPWCDTIAI